MMKPLCIAMGLVIAFCPAIADAKKKKPKRARRESQPEAVSTWRDTKVPPAKKSNRDPASNSWNDDDTSFAYGDDPFGDSSMRSLRMLLQVRYRSTFADVSRLSSDPVTREQQRATLTQDDGYAIRRAFLRYVASPSKYASAKFLVDFADLLDGQVPLALKLAYMEIRPTRRLQFDIGLLKRPYSLLELLPIAKHEMAELGPTDDFIKTQGYGGRDIGVVVRYKPLPERRMMTVSIGAFRGDIDQGLDASPLKLLGARIEVHPVTHLSLGVNAVWRPFDNTRVSETTTNGVTTQVHTTTMVKGAATGTDATLTYQNLEIRSELLLGKRTEPLIDPTGKQSSFWAAWVVIAPKIQIGKWWFVPAAKAEILEIDALNPGQRRRTVTGVLGLIPTNGIRIIADVTHTWTDPNLPFLADVPWKTNSTNVPEPDSTNATLQAQIVF